MIYIIPRSSINYNNIAESLLQDDPVIVHSEDPELDLLLYYTPAYGLIVTRPDGTMRVRSITLDLIPSSLTSYKSFTTAYSIELNRLVDRITRIDILSSFLYELSKMIESKL